MSNTTENSDVTRCDIAEVMMTTLPSNWICVKWSRTTIAMPRVESIVAGVAGRCFHALGLPFVALGVVH
jgi:hypothetical protein